MKTKITTIAMFAMVTTMGGCFELTQEMTLNPDGSGKVAIESIAPAAGAFGIMIEKIFYGRRRELTLQNSGHEQIGNFPLPGFIGTHDVHPLSPPILHPEFGISSSLLHQGDQLSEGRSLT